MLQLSEYLGLLAEIIRAHSGTLTSTWETG